VALTSYYCNQSRISGANSGVLVLTGTDWLSIPPAYPLGINEGAPYSYGRSTQYHVDAIGGGGQLGWQRNVIYLSTGAAWIAQHTVTGQGDGSANNWPHSPLVHVWGTDGRPYICGLAPDSGTGVVWVKQDVLTGTWTSGTTGLTTGDSMGHGNAVAYKNKLYAATTTAIACFNPVTNQVLVSTFGSPGPNGILCEHQDRLWFVGMGAGAVPSIWEIVGTTPILQGATAASSIGAGGSIGAGVDGGGIQIFFNGAPSGSGSGTRHFQATASSRNPFTSDLVVTEHTNPVLPVDFNSASQTLLGVRYALTGINRPSMAWYCFVDGGGLDAGPGSLSLNVHGKATGATGLTTQPYVFNGIAGTMTQQANGLNLGDVSWPGNEQLGSSEGQSLGTRVQVLGHEKVVGANQLVIRYKVYSSGGPSLNNVAVIYRPRQPGGTSWRGPQPHLRGTVAGPVVGGTLNVGNNRVESAPGDAAGTPPPLNELVWDYGTDGVINGSNPRVSLVLQ
jgi:hypothetical protein